jgi:prepilin signal peptidase PulO-like enzyme (type II secretory pathway)
MTILLYLALSLIILTVSVVCIPAYITHEPLIFDTFFSIVKNLKLRWRIPIFLIIQLIMLVTFSVIFAIKNNDLINSFLLLVVCSSIFALAVIDCEHRIVPNKLLFSLLLLRCLIYIIQVIRVMILNIRSGQIFYYDIVKIFISGILGSILLGGFFLIVAIAFKGGIGFGDVKLMFVLPLYLGIQLSITSIFFSLIFMFIISIIFLITKKWTTKNKVPFVPCIAVGTIFTILTTIMGYI